MRQINTYGIVLTRVDYGEADRIITFLTPDRGKVTVLARGVRKAKSKLAGGIELFSVSEIMYLVGRGEINTLMSSRLDKYYSQIVKDIKRTASGYDFIKKTNRATEDHPEPEYFELLKHAFEALDDKKVSLDLIDIWFNAQLLRQAGHTPNLTTDEQGGKLEPSGKYLFNFETMNFHKNGTHDNSFDINSIKFLRLIFSSNLPKVLQKIVGVDKLAVSTRSLVSSMLQIYIRL